MVFDQQDSSRNTVSRRVCDLRHSLRCCFWKHESDLCPRAWRRLNLGMTTMPFHDSVHFSKPEAGSCPPLRREERLERALTDFRRHADARVADLEVHGVRCHARAKPKRSAAVHRVERVLYEIEQRFAQLARDPTNHRHVGEVAAEMDHSATRALSP